MAKERKERLFNLPETKGNFQLKGVVTGTDKDGFFKEITTKNDKQMRIVNFGVEYSDGNTLYVNMNGIEQDAVYFSKKADKPGEKGDTQRVSWNERFKYNREGYRLIGNNIGVKKIVNSEGKTVNDKKTLTDFDSCDEIAKNLKDGSSVFVRGKLDISSFTTNDGGKRTTTKLVPSQVSLCADCDFSDVSYETVNDFNQTIVFMGIDREKDSNDKPTGKFILLGKIVNWGSIEDVQFYVTDDKLAGLFKKNLKPYWSIKVSGHIITETQTEEVADDSDVWGEADAMTKVTAPTRRLFVVSGAQPSTIDKETYTEENVNEAISKINKAKNAESSFGDDNSWGDSKLDVDDDEAWD